MQCYVKQKCVGGVLYVTGLVYLLQTLILVLKTKTMEQEELQQWIGDRVLEARTEKNLSKKQLSKLAQMSITQITQTEQGKRNVTSCSLRRFSEALDKPMKYFVPLHLLYYLLDFADCSVDVVV